ncbi:MAG: ornithine carbamoyltransferase [Candidatus Bathyarchaeia archaeon]
MVVSLRGRHFLSLKDFTEEELYEILDTAASLKLKLYRGEPHELLKGKTLGMIFSRPSTRTRISFETGMTQLGGHAQYLSTDLHALRAKVGQILEPWKDASRVISRYVDGIMARVDDQSLQEIVQYSRVPVISGATQRSHPCQVMADLLTIREKKNRLEGLNLALCWAFAPMYDKPPTLVYDTIYAGARLGMNITLACPEGYAPKETVDWAKREASLRGGSIEINHNLREAVDGADVIHTKCWVLPEWGEYAPLPDWGKEAPHRKNPEKYKGWITDSDLVARAKKDVIVMNAMPVARNQEMTDEVIEGPHSVLIDEAENRLHAQKGVLALILS